MRFPVVQQRVSTHENAWEIAETIDFWIVDSESVG
jgi:hypothetical protein